MRHDREPNDTAIPPPTSAARRTRMALIAALVGILAGIALSAWLIQRSPALAPSGLQTTIPARSQAPEFALPALDGDTVTLSSYRGQVCW